MKRILHIIGSMDRGGAETMLINLYRAIDRERTQFDFVYFVEKKTDYDEEVERLGGKIYRIVETNPVKRMNALILLLKQNPQWETVHAHTLFSNAFHVYAAYKAGVRKRIVHCHSTSDQSKNGVVSWVYQGLSRMVQSKYATDFVACGSAAGQFLFPNVKNVIIIPNSIDTKVFAEIGERDKRYLRDSFGLDEDTVLLTQIGSLSRVKNQMFSIDIVEELKKAKIKCKLFIIGRGVLKNELIQKTKDLGLENEVVFLGLRADIPNLLAGSDVMLMPSLYEGFPVSLVESQASGTIALISDTISKEVDLGLQLIYFESLKTKAKVWSERILELLPLGRLPAEERLKKLKEQGLDIYTNAKRLEELYKK